MKRSILAVLALVAVSAALAAAPASAQGRVYDLSLLGGVQTINKNDTALPDYFLSVPAVASLGYSLTSNLAVEGDLTWMFPVQRSVDTGAGAKADRRTPSLLAYQAGLRAGLPLAAWTPYVAAGAGAVTFLSSTASDRVPQLGKAQTMFALNFGTGATVDFAGPWAVRADLRELVAFPSKHAEGFSTDGTADPIWMERGTLGISYRF